MSLGLENLHLVPTIDGRIDVKRLSQLKYQIPTNAIENTYQSFPVTNVSPSSVTITCNPPSKQNFVDRRFYLQVTFRLVFSGNSGVAGRTLLQCPGLPQALVNPLANGNSDHLDAPRAYPLSNVLSTINVTLNNDSMSTNLGQYIRALTRYHNDNRARDLVSGYIPSMLDQSISYSDLHGSARNPLNSYEANPYEVPRGAYMYAYVERNDSSGTNNDVAIVNLLTLEPIYMSPLGFGPDLDQPSFIGLDACTIVATLASRSNSNQGLIAGLWSHDPGVYGGVASTFSGFSTTVTNASAIFEYYTPPVDLMLQNRFVYPFTTPIFYSNVNSLSLVAPLPQTTQIFPVSNLPTNTFNLNNIQLNSIPERVYIWISKRDADTDWTDTDTYFNITSVNIQFNNRAGVLSTAVQNPSLYDICVRNGSNITNRQFVHDTGSVLCLRFGPDIALADLLAPGSRGSFQFSAQINAYHYFNPNPNPALAGVIAQVNCLFIFTGTLSIENGSVRRDIGLLTQNDVLSVKKDPNEIPIETPPAYDALGGLKWPDVVNFLKRAVRTALNIGKVAVPALAPEFGPAVMGADAIARSLGVGKMRGGKKLTRKQMLQMMQ